MCDESKKALESAIQALARMKALELGIDPSGFANFTDLVWKIQLNEGNTRCYKMKVECDQDKCCWRRLCMGNRWL
jgi:hypothetical protein